MLNNKNKKTIVCIYTEGATDEVFYNRLLEFIKNKSESKKFIVDAIKKSNIQGIGNFSSKLLRKFKQEINVKEYKEYKKIVILCYDEDVFDFVDQTPPVNWKKLEKDLQIEGADKVIHLKAIKSIEDIFLLDIESILKSIGLSKNNVKNISGSGYQKLKSLYKKVNKMYYKGDRVENFVYNLDIGKICKNQCNMYCELCKVLIGKKGCD